MGAVHTLAVIPCRGGSRRLPRKALAELGGTPLLAWTIGCAKRAAGLDRIVVSTEDPEYAALARKCGIEVPWLRPAELATDEASSHDVLRHALEACERADTARYERVVLLQPTSPLRTPGDVAEGLRLFDERMADLVVSLCPMERPPAWCYGVGSGGALRKLMPASLESESPCVLNGAIYVYRRELVLAPWDGYPERTFGFIMPREASVDIDTADDLALAEFYLARAAKKS